MSPYDELAEWLHSTKALWYLCGGQAALLHGGKRATADIDLTVIGKPDMIETLLRTLPAGFEERMERAFSTRLLLLPLVHVATSVAVDITIGTTQYEHGIALRAELMDLAGARVPVICGEDLVLTKLLAGRQHDLDDIASLVTWPIDFALVRRWAKDFDRALGGRDLTARLDAVLLTPDGRRVGRAPSRRKLTDA